MKRILEWIVEKLGGKITWIGKENSYFPIYISLENGNMSYEETYKFVEASNEHMMKWIKMRIP